MAEKPGVVLYFDLLPVFEKLPKEDVADLLLSIMRYAKNREEPQLNSEVTKVVWSMIEQRINADDRKYKETVLKRRYAGYISKRKEAGMDYLDFDEWLKRMKRGDENPVIC